MDDEAKQLLREMRDIMLEDSKRNAAWIEEVRPTYTGRTWHAYAMSAMIVMVLMVLLFEILIALRLFNFWM